MQQQQQQQQQTISFVDKFLAEEGGQTTLTKSSIRLELARVKNRKERQFENLKKAKERLKQAIRRMREIETGYSASVAEERRLEGLLREHEHMDIT
jgi:hypothetical protein